MNAVILALMLIFGQVDSYGPPIAGATVNITAECASIDAVTDASGWYEIEVPECVFDSEIVTMSASDGTITKQRQLTGQALRDEPNQDWLLRRYSVFMPHIVRG